VYSITSFAAPTALKTSAVLDPGADVQIGGGVRVSDAFQAKLGWQLIAIWGRLFCVWISPAWRSSFAALRTRERRTNQRLWRQERGDSERVDEDWL